MQRLPAKKLLDPVNFLAFGFGSGLSPWAPGTAGTLVGVGIAWASLSLAPDLRLVIALVLVIAGVWICGESARRVGVHDHPGIVWDEIAGIYLVLLVAPPTVFGWAAGFGLFRLFDIWKPWPIRDLDHRLAGGTGIMLDDLVAALYAALLLGIGRWLLL
ncbi:MAG: phosphatidylglycerophosphatase A [Gammaproteobacteria bacterium]|nr:phosphatidylglycerophosphatase A [Gammaproteobacteria bacterium]